MIYNTNGCSPTSYGQTDSRVENEIKELEKITSELNDKIDLVNTSLYEHIKDSDYAFADITNDVSENTHYIADVDKEQLETAQKVKDLGTSLTTYFVDAKQVLSDGFGITNPDDPSTILPVKFYKNISVKDNGEFICNLTGKQILIMRGKNGSSDYAIIKYAGANNWITLSNIIPGDREERLNLNSKGDLVYITNSIPTAPKELDLDIYVIGEAPRPIQVDSELVGVDIKEGITTNGNVSTFSLNEFTVNKLNATDIKANKADITDAYIDSIASVNDRVVTLNAEKLDSRSSDTGNTKVGRLDHYVTSAATISAPQWETSYIEVPEFSGEMYLRLVWGDPLWDIRLKKQENGKTVTINYSKNPKYSLALYRFERLKDGRLFIICKGGTQLYWNYESIFDDNSNTPSFNIYTNPNIPPYTNDDVVAYYETAEDEHTIIMGDGTGLSGMYVVGGLGATTLDFGGDLSYDNLTITNNLSVENSITTNNITSSGTAGFNQVNGSDAQFATLDITGQTIAKDLIVTGDTHGTTATFNDVNTTNFNGKAVTDIFEADGTTVKKAANDIDNNPINTTYSKATNLVNGVGAQSIRQAGQTQADGVCSFASGHTTVANGNYSHAEGTGGGGKAWTHQCNVKGDFISSWTSWNGQTELPNVSVGDTLYIGTDISPYSVTKVERRQEGGGPSGVTTWIDIFIDRSASQTGMQDIYSYTSTTASGEASHAEGIAAKASGSASHAEGMGTTATGVAAHSEGLHTIATGDYQTAIGKYNSSNPYVAFVIGGGSGSEFDKRKNIFTVDWDGNVKANNLYKSAFKLRSTDDVLALKEGIYSIETEIPTNAPTLNPFALVEVTQTFVGENRFHTIYVTYATKNEVYFGTNTGAGWTGWSPLSTLSWLSHGSAEGSLLQIGNTASGKYSFAEGLYTTASQLCSHAEGQSTTASGDFSHAQGRGTIADGNCMTAIGRYNTKNSGQAFAIGNGTSDSDRKNIFTVDWEGNVKANNVTYANRTSMVDLGFTSGSEVTIEDLFKKIQQVYGFGSGLLRFEWSDANSAYITDGKGNSIHMIDCMMLYSFELSNVGEDTWSSYQSKIIKKDEEFECFLQYFTDTTPYMTITKIATTTASTMSAYNTGVTV